MAALNDLIAQIADPDLRDRIQQEVNKLNKQKKFGLVWENHEQENALLQGVPVKVGKVVAIKGEAVNDTYQVQSIADGQANCLRHKDQTTATIPVDQLVCIARVGDAIYPFLEPLDTVCNAPDSDLWHTLIEADNYHALQLLEYLYAGQVDCIYIDPPYNTGAKDWKYNNDYVDNSDTYRHSKWLSMMERRLRLAQKLLNPNNSVLILTIDEKEYLHIGCLLEEIFLNAEIQMVSSVINPKGSARAGRFSRVDEYIFFVFIGSGEIHPGVSDMLREMEEEQRSVRWAGLMRNGEGSSRARIPSLFYPIFIDKESGRFHSVGTPLPPDQSRQSVISPPNTIALFPVSTSGQELQWRLYPPSFMSYLEKGYIRFGRRTPDGKRSISYLQEGMIKKIEDGQITVTGRNPEGDLELEYTDSMGTKKPATIWNMISHSASEHGSTFIKGILPGRKFSYPKSVYAVRDCIKFVTAKNPNALLIDFFAGSGTTLHAVNLLNAEDGGHRRCILVTNNEVSNDEAKTLTDHGYHPGDPEWERLGIAKYITWPRTVCSIEGHDINGKVLKGNYIGSNRPMSEGFKANAAFFKLGFLDKTAVSLGRKFKELLPVMWMQAGAYGPCPTFEEMLPPPYLIFAENRFAILNDENCFAAFAQALEQVPEIETVFLMTESESGYQEMLNTLPGKVTHQLYREYTDHFRINVGR